MKKNKMGKVLGILFAAVLIWSCTNTKTDGLTTGIWRGELTLLEGKKLPFNFEVTATKGAKYEILIINGAERIVVPEITFKKDSITIKTPALDGYITGKFTSDEITGSFVIEDLDRIVPFKAEYGQANRFLQAKTATTNTTGVWETNFSPNTPDAYPGKGIFKQTEDKLTGTFRTLTGDYRFLEGVVDGDSLKLSAFDGSHAFLFLAKYSRDTLSGMFYSGQHYKTSFTATRNADFELPSPDSLTYIKEGYDGFDFSFPDSTGTAISLSDPAFKNKVVIVQLLGSWCPNCLDETQFLTDYITNNDTTNIKVVGLAFEYAKTETSAFARIARLVKKAKVPYPILLAQFGSNDKEKAQEKLPMLNHVLSYPTTLFIDKKGAVRKIHTGFNGPGTGEKFIEFKKEFHEFVTQLSKE